MLPLLLLGLALQEASPVPAPAPAPAPQLPRYAGAELLLREYLVLAAVDARGRRPFRPDAVLARHLVRAGSPAPQFGQRVRGETGEAEWSARTAGEDGRVGDVAWAYARVESDAARVVLARLAGASTLFVNGEPHTGDLYGYGFGGVPVALVEGPNELFVTGVRGAFRLDLAPCEEGLLVADWDVTAPTLTVGEAGRLDLGLLVWNASLAPVPELAVELLEGGGAFEMAPRKEPGLVPLGQLKLALFLSPHRGARLERPGELVLRLRISGHPDGRAVEHSLKLSVRPPDALAVRTRVSELDGSVQEYAVLPPRGLARERSYGIVLSLHGAGVGCAGQAGSYAPKEDFWIVAPTNRRPFGFDWQDWGRLDAYETLAVARHLPGTWQAPVFLTGHSMGGHGTWHLAANDPDTFAAIAPSAGWRSFDSYGGRPEGARRELWHAADAASRTEELLANLAQLPTYVLHGEADDNVPASEGHAMVAALRAAGAEPRSHFEPGAGHWWDDASDAPGAACLDWPGFFELFRGLSASSAAPRALDWTSVDPGVDAQHHWVSVEQPQRYGALFRVRARASADGRRLELATDNVRRLALTRPRGWEPEPPIEAFQLDGQAFAADFGADYLRVGERWSVVPRGADDEEKSAQRSGPLKRAFGREFWLLVPTMGTAEENAAALQRARHDAETWWYRGNGVAVIKEDRQLSATSLAYTIGRNLILYGNATINCAWSLVVPPEYPLEIRRGQARLGAREWEGEALGALAVGARREGGLFAVLGSSGPEADRAAVSLALFVSGVGYPDYVVYGPEVLAQGDGGVRAAGFLDHRWQLAAEPEARGR
ncbi:MAG TPA: prolyl oligopeptidase family serine peptidase [Planctomycetota bacterium]